ncbi:MAG: RNA methyltransferase [Methanomicrobiales archaeon]|nr:RNA methyltransferase [Methanomicrobiales archaeon]
MPDIQIVLVAPLYEGNIGFSARVMKNFGFSRLVLIDPCRIGEDALLRASHAQDVLSGAITCTLEEVFQQSCLTIATTGEVSKSICRSMRMPYFTPGEIREHIKDINGTISILFGRENWGLNNDEVKRCDMICTIPTSQDYPILNLSHAVGVVCYELAHIPRGEYLLANRTEMEYLYLHIDRFLDEIDHPPFKRENTMLMMRRIFGRTQLTAREASTVHGLLRRAEFHIDPTICELERERHVGHGQAPHPARDESRVE